jgi:predicted nucleic acid-binding protein
VIIVDSNVLIDVLENDPTWAEWSITQLRAQSQIHRLVINETVYAEISLTFSTVEALDQTIQDLDLDFIDIPKPALFLAGKAFLRYRRQGGTKSNVLGDFFIGAHAAVAGCAILTRDTRRFSSYFPTEYFPIQV